MISVPKSLASPAVCHSGIRPLARPINWDRMAVKSRLV